MKNNLTNFYEKIRDNVFVSEVVRSYVSLTKKGAEYGGLCPFHGEKTPSFTVNDRKKFYHCFGCGAHGDVIKFESEQTGASYKDAAYKIAEKNGIAIPTFSREEQKEMQVADKVMTLMLDAMRYYTSNMNSKIEDILIKRGIKKETITRYNIGFTGPSGGLMQHFAKKNIRLEDLAICGLVSKRSDGRYYEFFNNRIIIPIISHFGKVIAFGARALGDEMPKYLNSPENPIFKKGESLFGEDIAYSSAHKTGSVILVEGYFDVISLHQSSFQNTVASLGTAVTDMQLARLWKIAPEIIVCLDGDSAGMRASKKILNLAIELVSSEKKMSFAIMPHKLDPDEVIKRYGAQNLKRLIEERKSLSDYIFLVVAHEKPHKTAEDRAAIENELASYQALIKDPLLAQNMKQYFKSKCWELYNNRGNQKARQVSQLKTHESKEESRIASQTTERDKIDDLILGFICKNASAIGAGRSLEVLGTIAATSKRLEFIDYITDILNNITSSDGTQFDTAEFEKNIKNTSFCDEFAVLCARYKGSIETLEIYTRLSDVLDYLLSKRYLHILMEEFKAIMDLQIEGADEEAKFEKTKFYLSEIKSTREKINNFDTGFAL